MTDTPDVAVEAAVLIAVGVVPLRTGSSEDVRLVRAAVAALARAGRLHDPKRVAALEAVAAAARGLRAQVDKYGHAYDGDAALDILYAALDVAPAGTTAEGEA